MACRGMSSWEIAGNCHCCVLVVCFRDLVKQKMRKIGARGVQLAGLHESGRSHLRGTADSRRAELETELLFDDDHLKPTQPQRSVDDQDLVQASAAPGRLSHALVLQRGRVLLQAPQTLLQGAYQFLCPHDPDHSSRSGSVWSYLAPTARGDQHLPLFGHRVDTAQHEVGAGGQLAELAPPYAPPHPREAG